jgi:hypothetical protein
MMNTRKAAHMRSHRRHVRADGNHHDRATAGLQCPRSAGAEQPIDVLAVAKAHNENAEDGILNLVNDAIGSYANAIGCRLMLGLFV